MWHSVLKKKCWVKLCVWYNATKKKITINIAVFKSFKSSVCLRLPISLSSTFNQLLTLTRVIKRDILFFFIKKRVMIISFIVHHYVGRVYNIGNFEIETDHLIPASHNKQEKENLPNRELCRLGGPQSENQRKQKERQILGLCRRSQKNYRT